MIRSPHAQRHWRRRVLGVGLTASLLLVGPTAVWAEGEDGPPGGQISDIQVSALSDLGDAPGSTPKIDGAVKGDSEISESPKGATVGIEDDLGIEEVATSQGDGDDDIDDKRGTSSFRNLNAATTPSCEPGYVYAQSSDGYILQVDPNGNVTTLGNKLSVRTNSFNGLGIAADGNAYGYTGGGTRSVSIYRYNPVTGNWTSTNQGEDTTVSGKPTTYFVAGAVNLNTGEYYFGGFSAASNADRFEIWKYNPGSNSTSYVGYINTPYQGEGSGAQANGDMAFDQAGNLYIVRGTSNRSFGTDIAPTYARIFSVQAASLNNPSSPITSSPLNAINTGNMINVNGIAFAADGRLLLSNGKFVRSGESPNFANPTERTSGLDSVSGAASSTDLATCASPPTVTISKYVHGKRVNPTDEFEITLRLGDQNIGSIITNGPEEGKQTEQIGPVPAVREQPLTFEETPGNATTILDDYATSYRCKVDGVLDESASGDGRIGTVTIPTGADEVTCEVHNSPLAADITIQKNMLDVLGENSQTQEGWGVSAVLTDMIGGATIQPDSEQMTGLDGTATWRAVFDNQDDSATVTVSEEDRDGFEFVDAACTVTHLDGRETRVEITDTSGDIEGLVPGDNVVCVFNNKPSLAELSVEKQWVINDGPVIDHEDLDSEGLEGAIDAQLSVGGAGADWGIQTGPYVVGETVTIAETATLDTEAFPRCMLGAASIRESAETDEPLGTGLEVELTGDSTYVITNYVNCEQTLTLVKDIDNDYEGELFPGDWSINDASAWDGALFAQNEGEPELPFDSGETKQVSDGEYALSEGNVAGYLFDGLECVGGDLNVDTNTVLVDVGQEVQCTFTNKIAPGSVTWEKVGEGESGLLSGSEWRLEGPNGIDERVNSEVEPGKFRLEGLPWGDYTLTETKPPAGYILDDTPRVFTISADERDFDFADAFVNVQRDGPDLPLTGGIGRDHVYIAGALTALLGMAAYFYTTRRRQA